MNQFPDRALYAGIPNAAKAFMQTYEACSRRSGRTSAMVAQLQDGDKIIFADAGEALRVRTLAAGRGVSVDCVVVEPSMFQPGLEAEKGRRVLFDHGWLYQYWLDSIDRASAKFWEMHELYNPSYEEAAPCPKDY